MLIDFRNQIIEWIKKHLPTVKLIYLFGSYASNEANDSSDIDIVILPGEKLTSVQRWELQQKLAEKLNIDVDLVDLLSASTVMQKQIIAKGLCLFDANQNVGVFEMKVMSMYQHLNDERSELLVEFKEGS